MTMPEHRIEETDIRASRRSVGASNAAGRRTNVVFFLPPVPQLEDDRVEPHQGTLALATALEQAGHHPSVIDLAVCPAYLAAELVPDADCYAFPTFTLTYPDTQDFVSKLRPLHSDALFVAGGPHASALPELVLEDFDVAVVGEADEDIVEIADAIADGRPPAPGTVRRPKAPDVSQLSIVDPDRFVNLDDYHRRVDGEPAVSLVSSRGCPHRCAFCNSTVLGSKFRPRTLESVEREIRLHLGRGRHSFRFNDDNFAANPGRLRELARRLERLEVAFRAFVRADDLAGPGVADLLARAGAVHVSVGVESLSDWTLRLMRKRETASEILRGLECACRAGLRVRIYLIVGFPGETAESVKETLEGLVSAPFHEFSIYNFCPYPGTDVFRHPERYGIREIRHDWGEYLQIGRDKRSARHLMVMKSAADQEMVERTDELRRDMIEELQKRGYTWSGDAEKER
jgi:radical SAM superfamily enzyme YgiQ (UPF0313 family)